MLRFGLTRGCVAAVCLLLMRVGACFWQRLPWGCLDLCGCCNFGGWR